MDAHQLGFGRTDLAVTDVTITSSIVVVRLASTATQAPCPRCGREAERIHSRYLRTLTDLACHNRSVLIRLQVRRFRCLSPECPQSIFSERFPGLAEARARTTARLSETHRLVGLFLGGEAGSRLANHLAIPTSPDTILRRVKQTPGPATSPPRFVGIDDWAWRKGRRYGTIVVDLERGQVIDLLPDRDAETVKKWLDAHPSVELISRDRWPSYGQAASQLRQVADRWHLLKNLRESLERLFQRRADDIAHALRPPISEDSQGGSAAGQAAENPPSEEVSTPGSVRGPIRESPRQQVRRIKREHRVERFDQVNERHRQGQSARQIAQELGLSRCSVRSYLRSSSCPDWTKGRKRRSRWDEHREWIESQLAAGRVNAAALHRELAASGFAGSYGSVRRYVARRRSQVCRSGSSVERARRHVRALPSAKQLSFDWVRRPENRSAEARSRLDAIRAETPELASALTTADAFTELIRKRAGGTLADWLTVALSSPCPEMRSFAEGIRRDESAVSAAMTSPWSNGPVEGQVNRLKMIKRSMYGRAGFQLLRARVIRAA